MKDCLTVFGERESMKTENLIEGLKILPESDYAGLNYGRGISPKYLAKIVRAYEIQPTQIRFGESTFKGYYRIQFATAYERYSEEAPAPSTPETIETPETVEG